METDATIDIIVVPGAGKQTGYINTEAFGLEIGKSRGKPINWVVAGFDITVNTPHSRNPTHRGNIDVDDIGLQAKRSITAGRQRQVQIKILQTTPWRVVL